MDPAFYKAAMDGNTKDLKEKGKEIESILTPNKNTILHIHLMGHNVSEAFVEEILSMCPALLTKPNAKGETLLHIAARYGYHKLVRKMIERDKGLVKVTNGKQDTALHEAVRFNHIEIVDILTKEEPDLSEFVNSDGETPLYIAAEREYLDVVLKISENCISPKQDGPNGRTALHAAVLLRNKDYDRNTAYMRDKRGMTALHFAALCGNICTVEKIVQECADCAELVDEKGCNALHYIVGSEWKNEKDWIPSIDQKKIPPLDQDTARIVWNNPSLSNLYNEKDDKGNTPLHYLASKPKSCSDLFLKRSGPSHSPTVLDAMAFNSQNETAIDIAYDNSRRYLSPYSDQIHMVKGLQELGSRFGGRIVKKEGEKKRQDQDTSDLAPTNKKSKEKDDDDDDDDDIPKPAERVMSTNMVVATLISTVTFAAEITMPGGFVQEHDASDKGSPLLKHKSAFQAFVITDSLAFALSTTSLFLLIFVALYDRQQQYVFAFLGATSYMLTVFAILFMMMAFWTGTYAVLGASIAFAVVNLLVTLLTSLSIYFLFSFFGNRFEKTCQYMVNLVNPARLIFNARRIQLSQSYV